MAIQWGGAKVCRMPGVAALQRRRRRPWIAASPFGLLARTAGSVIAPASASTTARHSKAPQGLVFLLTLNRRFHCGFGAVEFFFGV
ncbi:hypothetical protein DFR50_10937 [Roseiarcus fermentans]|uniref:Uncharacterized protein n=1 Tax=Roseiarcus fermentans TaxID=1473586 RepID=A0A366FHZ6_9HYPH|nr:hypothetical protein DFR50_10937 [Roseiarcus fermentans]